MGVIYLDVASALRTAIRNGDYAQKPFPSETQLMRKFGIGRQPLNASINPIVRSFFLRAIASLPINFNQSGRVIGF